MKNIGFWLVFMVISGTVYGQSESYQIYLYREAGFKIAFPNEPSLEKKEGKYTTWQYRSKSRETAYGIVITELDKSLKKQHQIQLVNGIVKTLTHNGIVTSSESFSGGTGINLKFRNADNVYIQCRILVHQNKIFQLLVISDKSYINDKRVTNYFESFSIL